MKSAMSMLRDFTVTCWSIPFVLAAWCLFNWLATPTARSTRLAWTITDLTLVGLFILWGLCGIWLKQKED